MKSTDNPLLMRLEAATSSDDDVSRDHATTALRESWIGLAQTLRNQRGDYDDARLLAGIRAKVAARRRKQFARWSIAATIMLSLSVGFAVLPRSERLALNSVAYDAGGANASGTDERSTPARDFAEWTDELDAEIEAAWDQVATLRADWNSAPSSARSLQSRLQELAADLDKSTL